MEIDAPPHEVWVHPAVEVRPSPIEGTGLFATRDLAADTVVVRLGGRLVTTAELHALFEAAGQGDGASIDTFALGNDTHVVLPAGTIAHHGNHSCAPTMWPVGTYELATCRAVAADEELTLDYGVISDDETWRMDCRCGDPACRQVVTGEDWRRPDLQDRYAGHWPPGLRRRIER